MIWLVKLALNGSWEVKILKRTHKQTDDGQVKKKVDIDYKTNWT